MCTMGVGGLKERAELQRRDILSPKNMWYAGEVLGHSPSPDEAFWHWFHNGGREAFNRRWDEAAKRHAETTH